MPGMQKSGTSWVCNMLVDLVIGQTGRDLRALRAELGLLELLAPYYTPTFREKLTENRINRLLAASNAIASPFVFKTHRPPTDAVWKLIDSGRAKATYIFRDPRDVLLSALNHGVRERAAGRWPIRGFARLTNIERALRWFERRVYPVYREWSRKEEVLLVRYEDLVSSPVATMQRVAAHVGLNRDVGVITTIVERYAAASVKTPEIRKALHLSDGPKGKKIESFSPDERAMLDQRLGPILGSMSY